MQSRGELRIDPGSIAAGGGAAELEVVVLHVDRSMTEALLKRATELTAGLNARVLLLAVLTIPFPASYASASASHAFLANQLVELAEACPLPVVPHVVLARGLKEGVRFVLKDESTILVGARTHFWRTRQERLARALARDGHKVALLYVE